MSSRIVIIQGHPDATQPRFCHAPADSYAADVGGTSVGGWLRPYPDPEVGCLLDTWFEGTLTGDTLDGMYFSYPADTAASVRLGTWWVARQR